MIEELDASGPQTVATQRAHLWIGPGRILASVVGALIGLSVVLTMDTLGARDGSFPSPVACEEPTTLVAHPNDPSFTGAPLGPLLLRNFAEGETAAIITEYSAGYATKVVTVVARPFASSLTLRGWRCSDHAPLRFAWAYPFATNSTPAPSDVFATSGEEAPIIQPMSTMPTTGVYSPSAPPYFLFASTGKWLIEVRQGESVVGRAVILVRGK